LFCIHIDVIWFCCCQKLCCHCFNLILLPWSKFFTATYYLNFDVVLAMAIYHGKYVHAYCIRSSTLILHSCAQFKSGFSMYTAAAVISAAIFQFHWSFYTCYILDYVHSCIKFCCTFFLIGSTGTLRFSFCFQLCRHIMSCMILSSVKPVESIFCLHFSAVILAVTDPRLLPYEICLCRKVWSNTTTSLIWHLHASSSRFIFIQF